MKRIIALLFVVAFMVGTRPAEIKNGVAIAENAVDVDGVVYLIDNQELRAGETYVLKLYGGRVLRCVDLEVYELEKMEVYEK